MSSKCNFLSHKEEILLEPCICHFKIRLFNPKADPEDACQLLKVSPDHHGPGWSHPEVDSNFWKLHWLSSFLRSLLLRITQFRLGYEPAAGKRCIRDLISFIDYFPVQILQGASSPWDGYPCVGKPEINKSIQKKLISFCFLTRNWDTRISPFPVLPDLNISCVI